MASAAGEPLLFRGFPRLVRGFAPIPHAEIAAAPREIVLDGADEREALMAQTVPRGPNTEIRFRLPENTAPGEYRGTLRLGERSFAIVARVDANSHLASIPPRIDLLCAGAGESYETLVLANDGNTAATIEPKYRFGLFSETGLDRAIGTAFQGEAHDGHERIDMFLSAAAKEYGGIATATVEDGDGAIEPGQTRGVTFAFRFSKKARPGTAYFGYLPVANLRIPVRVRTEQPANPTEVPS